MTTPLTDCYEMLVLFPLLLTTLVHKLFTHKFTHQISFNNIKSTNTVIGSTLVGFSLRYCKCLSVALPTLLVEYEWCM